MTTNDGNPRPWRDSILPWLTGAAMTAAIVMVFLVVPDEREQGVVQRIFYFHVAAAWLAFAGFALGAMPVGLGTMRRLAESLGPAPRAFLVITLAASLFADAANAIGITTLFALLE